MNKDQFISYLENPTIMEANAGALLSELILDFPFFQSAHMLYLKHLSKEKSAKYAPQLKITATYANDRKKLYELVIREDLQSKIKLVDQDQDSSSNENKITPLEEEILKEAVNASIQLEVTKPGKRNKSPIAEITPPPQPLKSVKKTGPKSFTDWLTAIHKDSIDSWENTPSNISLIDSFITENPKIGSLQDKGADGSAPKEKDAAEFFNPVNTARLSIVDEESFVTETLAKIYEVQNCYDKAIKAYEILSLKYPEKRNTFAARIDTLKKERK